jgi:transcriptional regulator
MLILRTLELRALHGVAIADRINQLTQGAFIIQAGSLFPALHRLEHEAWIEGTWSMTDDKRRVKTYALTPAGRRHLSSERKNWARVVAAISQVLDGA